MRRALLLLPLLLAACAPAVQSTQAFPDTVVTLPAANSKQVRVLVMGDQGKGGAVQAAVARGMTQVCAAQGCDLSLGMGDNFYPQAPTSADAPAFQERFAALYGPLHVPFLLAAGNHDESWLLGGDGADAGALRSEVEYARVNPQWVMPARFYRARWASLLQVFVVDTAPLASYLPNRDAVYRVGGPFDAAQRSWLKRSLDGSSARWNIVVGHHPLLNNGQHGNAGTYDGGVLPWARGEAVSALYQGAACGRADVIASGHDHTLQLFGPGTLACPGTRLIVSGAAGESSGPGSGQAQTDFQAMSTPGFFWLDLTPEHMEIQAYTVDAGGMATLAYREQVDKP